MAENTNKVSTDSYKGVRDFYPEDMAIQNYIFNVWRKTAESFGYVEYGASILEPTELYKAKSGEEIVNEQTYSFRDRGDRDVTLRPEMTPTVARMVAAKRKELKFPLRWYSIPNLFRYEKPQRGRVREHWQLNCDIFGIESIEADIEIISIAYQIMKNFGLNENQFEIRIGSRKWLDALLAIRAFNEPEEIRKKIIRLLDKPDKDTLKKIEELGIPASAIKLEDVTDDVQEKMGVKELLSKLKETGIKNAFYDPSIIRGFAYYTGIVFEIYDKNPANPRALFGGGRYDNLLNIFGSEKIPAIGFGMGDVTIRDVLETYNLLPGYTSSTKLYLCPISENEIAYTQTLAQKIRDNGVNVAIDYSGKKVGDQIHYADKNKIPFVMIIGENEMKTGKLKAKELSTGTETEVTEDTISQILK